MNTDLKEKPEILNYADIEIKLGDELLRKGDLRSLRIIKKINDHTKIYFTEVLTDLKKDQYVEMADEKTMIEVTTGIEKSTILFKGMVTNVEVKMVHDVYYLEVEGASFTFDMDVKLNTRSFQDKEMSYEDLVNQIIAEYPGADCIDTVTKRAKLEKIVLQWHETDWELLKRLASHFNIGLIPEHRADKPKFWFGIREGDEKILSHSEELNFSAKKKIFHYRKASENYIEGIATNDFTYYTLQTETGLEIGDTVNFRGRELTVCECLLHINGANLKQEYVLATPNGLKQNYIQNRDIAGISIGGNVLAVEKDHVRVHLEIDVAQDEAKAFWFPYTTFYSNDGGTGWYCMPEVGDYVKLYFPTAREEEGLVTSSVRKSGAEGDKIDDPTVKYFRTKSGKELMFSDQEIVITAKDGEVLIRLDEENGIEILSKKHVNITAEKDLIINSKQKVAINAGEEISMICKQSNIKMNGITDVKGTQVKTN